ncbi:hypothetical protein B9G98_01433 [Wickerhamiella sorbophila]|uniref:37S ribosomal protein MRP21, mitochondrial n=1 Tax=Wickerhamiella sorbophila TaxID=45607 RepID=A0A2T0FFN8_9ASCO|nr:hypothetical protein B9G98_01433 [Wickerhamiella sorbophila]PRT53813.1 hypothetical protein B9G98_01433 [Wickerhamiella sorbophila]
MNRWLGRSLWTGCARTFSTTPLRANKPRPDIKSHKSLMDLLQSDTGATSRLKTPGRVADDLLFQLRSQHQRIMPPRTGVLVGRSAPVPSPELLNRAVRQVNTMNRVNAMKETVNLQRFAERPGKARLRIRIQRKRREFNAGVRRLFQLVKRAKRQGY